MSDNPLRFISVAELTYLKSVVVFRENLVFILDQLWETEYKHFCETYAVQSQDIPEDWIRAAEDHPEMKTHIFYHLMTIAYCISYTPKTKEQS